MLCLTRQAGMADLSIEACTGAAAQLWSKDIHGFIRHQSSGTCLSSLKVTVLDLGKFGQTITAFPLLHLAACENGRADQIWDGFSSYPGLH